MTRKTLFALLIAAALPVAHAQDFDRPLRPAAKPAGPGAPVTLAVTDADVGDAASFGRGVVWLGVFDARAHLSSDCTIFADDPAPCQTLAPAPGFTAFDFPALGTLSLPARATESLLCHSQTPNIVWSASNPTPSPQQMTLQVTPYYVVESAVLDDVIDPRTGVSYGGRVELPLTAVYASQTLHSGDFVDDYDTGTRMCIAGMLNRKTLVGSMGFTEAQARQLFRQPMTITLGLRGSAQLVDDAQLYVGTRFYGD